MYANCYGRFSKIQKGKNAGLERKLRKEIRMQHGIPFKSYLSIFWTEGNDLLYLDDELNFNETVPVGSITGVRSELATVVMALIKSMVATGETLTPNKQVILKPKDSTLFITSLCNKISLKVYCHSLL